MPENDLGPYPASFAYFLTMFATDLPLSRFTDSLPRRSIERNIAPSAMPDAASHARTASTGQSFDPKGIPIILPCPSWSVFERRMLTRSPPGRGSRSATFKATSSDRRKAPAKPQQQDGAVPCPTRLSGTDLAMVGPFRLSLGSCGSEPFPRFGGYREG